MSARELNGWREFYRLEPFGPARDNWHSAVLATIFTNAHRKRSSPAAKVQDFMYVDSETSREQEEMAVVAWFDQHSEPN